MAKGLQVKAPKSMVEAPCRTMAASRKLAATVAVGRVVDNFGKYLVEETLVYCMSVFGHTVGWW